MDGVRGNGADLFFECAICSRDDGYVGQLGGRSLVKPSCDTREVFHLECITEWLESAQKSARTLDQRQCICRQPALPLIRMDGKKLLDDESPYCETQIFNYCRTGNLPELRTLLRQDEALANRTYHSVTSGHPEHLLAVALKNEHTDLVRLLIDYHADVNAVEHNGETILHIAARAGRTEDFNMLIRAGADINNVLRTAVQEGDIPLLEYLSSTEPGQLALNNALLEAAERGQTQHLEILITAGANNLDDALNIAVLSDYTEGRLVLEQHGANIFTALNTAAREGSLEFFNLLYDRHINETDEEGQTPLHIIAANGHSGCLERMLEISTEKVNARNNSGETALHLAVCNGHVECLRKLIEKGANLNATKNNGETALHIAASWGRTECLRKLLEMNADINVKIHETDATPLHIAAQHGFTEIVKELARDLIFVNEKLKDGNTALHLAVSHGHTETVKAIIAIHRSLSDTALHYADQIGRTEIVVAILGMKCSLSFAALRLAALKGRAEANQTLVKIDPSLSEDKDRPGETAHNLVWCNSHKKIARVLGTADGYKAALDRTDTVKARVDKRDNDGKTAPHLAAFNGRAGAVNKLLGADGINVNEMDNNGNTALHKAGGGNESAGIIGWSDFSGFFKNHRLAGKSFASKSSEKPAPLKYRSGLEERIDTQLQRLSKLVGEVVSDRSVHAKKNVDACMKQDLDNHREHVRQCEGILSSSTVPETKGMMSDYWADKRAEFLQQFGVLKQAVRQQAQTFQSHAQFAPPKAQTAQPKAQTVRQQTQADQEHHQRPPAQSAADTYTLTRQGMIDALRDSLDDQAKMDDKFGHFGYRNSK